MEKQQRPISPFMLGSGYKLQQTAIMSFLHRATGVASLLVLLVIGSWICAIPVSAEATKSIQSFLLHPLFFPFLAAGVASMVYHLCNGIRHLFWDAGIGVNNEAAEKSAQWVIAGTVIITVAILSIGIFA